MSIKTAIYCRLSEEDRNKLSAGDDSNSIQNQKAMLVQYAKEQGWEVYSIYSDDNYTGSDRNRPEFRRLLADAKARRFHVILCKTQSRFTRELELVEQYIHGFFPLWGIRFVSVVDHADTDNQGNKKSRQINGLVNEWYLEDMSENIRSVLTNRRKNGYHIGAFALYGYQKDPCQKGHLIVDQQAAAVVREIFVLFSKGYGKTAIARLLNDRGVPNPSEYKRLQGLRYHSPPGKTGTLWKYSTIAGMLTNEMYIGNMIQGKYGSVSYKTKQNRPRPKEQWYRVEHTHEAIIDRDLWDQVQNLIRQREKPFSTGCIGLFAGKVRCMNCGYIMHSVKSHGRHYLQCSSRHVATEACKGAFISVNLLETIILGELNCLTTKYLDMDALNKTVRIYDETQTQHEKVVWDIHSMEREIETNCKSIQALYLDKSRGILLDGEFLKLLQSFRENQEQLERNLKVCRIHLAQLEEQLHQPKSRQEVIERYSHPQQLTREMVNVLIDYVAVGRREKGQKIPPVEIHWNF